LPAARGLSSQVPMPRGLVFICAFPRICSEGAQNQQFCTKAQKKTNVRRRRPKGPRPWPAGRRGPDGRTPQHPSGTSNPEAPDIRGVYPPNPPASALRFAPVAVGLRISNPPEPTTGQPTPSQEPRRP
jgi:hypothetical protein